MFCGGAPLKTEVFEFMKAVMGCPMYNGYGQTENSGAAFFQYGEDPICGHSGAVLVCSKFIFRAQWSLNFPTFHR